MLKKNITILAIDTSCDDTCVSIVKCKKKWAKRKNYLLPLSLSLGSKKNFEVLSNVVSSQIEIHRKYGGVYPTLAKREHQKNLPLVFKKALRQSQNEPIDLIAVTVGPGLEPCLWMGVNFAKDLAKKENLPIVPVNHIEAHILANFLDCSINKAKHLFPAICLVVSGGHTQLILMRELKSYKLLGETRDDAAGECLDKTARILGLGYPGGPAIEEEASRFKVKDSKFKITLPRPMIHQKNYDFSFSGLKTAVLYDFKSRSLKTRVSKDYIGEMAKEIQQAIIDVLIHKTIRATKAYKAESVILGGGVAANTELRKQLNSRIKSQKTSSHLWKQGGRRERNSLRPLKVNFLVPAKNLCTDNAAMVAVAGYYQWLKKGPPKTKSVEANANQRI